MTRLKIGSIAETTNVDQEIGVARPIGGGPPDWHVAIEKPEARDEQRQPCTEERRDYGNRQSRWRRTLFPLRNAAGAELLWQAGPRWPRHAPLLFPIVGRLKNGELRSAERSTTQHGFARDQRFEWLKREPASRVAAC